MNRFLLGAIAMGAVFVLTSFAVRVPSDPVLRKDGPAWRVSDYRLDRAFRIYGNLANQTVQVPATGGFIITQIRVGVGATVAIGINGATESIGAVWGGGNGTSSELQNLNPPIIVRPGDVLSYSSTGPLGFPADVTIAGYATYPGET
jgi:hypothetical protein